MAAALASARRRGPRGVLLRGAVILCIFGEPSTRTRLSFEVAARRLGAQVIDFRHDDRELGRQGRDELDALRNLDAMGFDAASSAIGRDGWSAVALLAAAGAGDQRGRRRARAPDPGAARRADDPRGVRARACAGGARGLRVAICGDLRHGRVGRSNLRLLRALGAEVVLAGPPGDRSRRRRWPGGGRRWADLDSGAAGVARGDDAADPARAARAPDLAASSSDAAYHAAWGLTSGALAAAGPGGRGAAPRADEPRRGDRGRGRRRAALPHLASGDPGVAVRMAVLARACGVSRRDMSEGAIADDDKSATDFLLADGALALPRPRGLALATAGYFTAWASAPGRRRSARWSSTRR
jgi:aspartate carbamoyltransferase catalytic subunit